MHPLWSHLDLAHSPPGGGGFGGRLVWLGMLWKMVREAHPREMEICRWEAHPSSSGVRTDGRTSYHCVLIKGGQLVFHGALIWVLLPGQDTCGLVLLLLWQNKYWTKSNWRDKRFALGCGLREWSMISLGKHGTWSLRWLITFCQEHKVIVHTAPSRSIRWLATLHSIGA